MRINKMNNRMLEMNILLRPNDNDKKKNWRNGLFAISPMLIVQFKPNFK